MAHRQKFVDNLLTISTKLHDKLSHGKEKLVITYAQNVKQDFAEALRNARQNDLFRKQTSVGPHRDDLQFVVNDIDIANFGSQGQQRTTALSIKLAEIDSDISKKPANTILLLDDVMSELDNQRQLDLLSLVIGKTQTLYTTALDIWQLINLTVFQVSDGEILKQD